MKNLKQTYKDVIKLEGIDEIINHRQRKLVLAYIEMIKLGWKNQSRLNRIMPSNLKYGGHRNTCYDLKQYNRSLKG